LPQTSLAGTLHTVTTSLVIHALQLCVDDRVCTAGLYRRANPVRDTKAAF